MVGGCLGPGPGGGWGVYLGGGVQAHAQGGVSQHALRQTPPTPTPQQTATAADGTHPTGMNSCWTSVLFVGPLISSFCASGDIYPGLQSLLVASMAAKML